MDIKKCVQSKKFKIAVGVLGTLFVASLIFQAGIFVGYHKAAFSYGYGDNYYRTFGERHARGGMMWGDIDGDRDLTPANGVIGKIVKVELPNIVVVGTDSIEKVVVIAPDTAIRQFRDTVATDKLQVGDVVTVIGEPNAASQIEAKYIRLMPQQMGGMMWGTSTTARPTTTPLSR